MKIKKKTSNRATRKYPGLCKQTSLRSREELVDYDYLDKLNDEELKFLNQFTEEWVHDRVYPSKDGKYKPKFHKTKAERKRVNDMNNARNRDTYGKAKMLGKLEPESVKNEDFYEPEETLIEEIDKDLERTEIFKKLKG